MKGSRPVTSPARALTIAGSDSSGGAGIQADLKTFAAHRVWGATAITALTAQNEHGVRAVWTPEPDFVIQQIEAALDEAPVQAAKTGMLGHGLILSALCAALERRPIPNLVVDPVLVATSGALLFETADVELYRTELIPRAMLVTPNLPEASQLTGRPVLTLEDMEDAARALVRLGARAALVKGGHHDVGSDLAVDVLFDGQRSLRLEGQRYAARSTHGTGCTLSAAITAHLALGRPLIEAVQRAKLFTADAIAGGFRWRGGGGLNHFREG
jgi:hydroxymethylpyrimidine/phosphomethylpyrimidine kinase